MSDDQRSPEIAAALAAPFASDQVQWRPVAISGRRALVVPFVDARAVMVGRFLYAALKVWVDYDPATKAILAVPQHLALPGAKPPAQP
jgi:hypothetical protein